MIDDAMVRVTGTDRRRQLLLESAFAAVNYDLKAELEQLVGVLPFVVDSPSDLRLCQAFMLWTLDRTSEAFDCLNGCDCNDARMLLRVMRAHAG
jgi:type III secretion system SsaH family protein